MFSKATTLSSTSLKLIRDILQRILYV